MYEPLDNVVIPRRSLGNHPGIMVGWHEEDNEARIQHLIVALSEHPATRPHLEAFGLAFIYSNGLLTLSGGHFEDVGADFNLALWRDPELRALIVSFDLMVYDPAEWGWLKERLEKQE